MAEATEEIVKVYLEQKGYLVTLSKRVNAKTHPNAPRAELDIVAILTNGKKTNSTLPRRIVGEVKSYGVGQRDFEKLDKKLRARDGYKSRPLYERYKWVNNKDYRNDIFKALKEEYGYEDFKYVLFCAGTNNKYHNEIIEFLKNENIQLITHKEVLKDLLENTSNEYTDSQVMQILRIIKSQTKNIEF